MKIIPRILLFISFACSFAATMSAATIHNLRLDGHDLFAASSSLAVGESLEIRDFPVHTSPVTLDLKKFEIFDPNAVVYVDGQATSLSPPSSVRLRGKIVGEPESRVLLTVLPDGTLRGLLQREGSPWLLQSRAGGIAVRRIAPRLELVDDASGFTCARTGERESTVDAFRLFVRPEADPQAGRTATMTITEYVVHVAVETDYELYQAFGSSSALMNHVGDLLAYASTIFEAEISTRLDITSISVWTSSNDPWKETDTFCALEEFSGYWNLNRDHVKRTVAFQMSGKPSSSGAAWFGVLCRDYQGERQTDCSTLAPAGPYFGDFGYMSGIEGDFDIKSPQVIWEIYGVLHEIGHTFDARHSHCYNGVDGQSEPVDRCYGSESGCYSGPTSLPGSGNRTGTLMSYCHFLPGGMDNVALTFGDGHPYGVEPERIPNQMRRHVIEQAEAFPGCIDSNVLTIFTDGFESGNTSAWSAQYP